MAKIGIIGGSGLYDIEELEQKKWHALTTPFGEPSDEFLSARFAGRDIVFLSRHKRGHLLSPTQINYRANIYGMKALGVEKIISVSACGSLRDELKPMDFVLPLQFVDRTSQARKHTFFDEGIVVHIGFSEPICKHLAEEVYQAARATGVSIHFGGTYVAMEGPQFSTLAESNLYRSWGMDIIGMTNMTEARLAREAEICYATLASVTDYDCWHPDHATVTVEMILKNLEQNILNSKKVLRQTVSSLSGERSCGCKDALKFAIVTPKNLVSSQVKDKLKVIAGRYLS